MHISAQSVLALSPSLAAFPQVIHSCHYLRQACGFAHMAPARNDRASVPKEARRRPTARDMLRMAWRTFIERVAPVIPVRRGLYTESTAVRRWPIVGNTLWTVWWTLSGIVAHMPHARRSLNSISKAAGRESTAGNMLRTA